MPAPSIIGGHDGKPVGQLEHPTGVVIDPIGRAVAAGKALGNLTKEVQFYHQPPFGGERLLQGESGRNMP